MKSDFIWMDGELVPYEQATVHFITPTLHYGMGVFEGIRCYATPKGPAVFRLKDHLVRFLESIHILGLRDFPYSVDVLRQAVHDTIRKNGFSECYIRPLMYLEGPMGLNMDHSRPVRRWSIVNHQSPVPPGNGARTWGRLHRRPVSI